MCDDAKCPVNLSPAPWCPLPIILLEKTVVTEASFIQGFLIMDRPEYHAHIVELSL